MDPSPSPNADPFSQNNPKEPLLGEKLADPKEVPFELPDNVEEEAKIIRIFSYRLSKLKTLMYAILSIVTGGFYFLLCKWYLKLKIRSMYIQVPIEEATDVLIYVLDETFDLFPVKYESFSLQTNQSVVAPNSKNIEKDLNELMLEKKAESYKTFDFRLFKYYFDPTQKKFLPIKFTLQNLTNYQIHEIHGRGHKDQDKYLEKKALYGLNSTEVPEKPIAKILVDEILSPFYLFQIFSCALWFYDAYQIYASVILVTTVISILMTLWDAYHNMKNLRKMSFYETDVFVYRGVRDYLDTSSKEKTNIDPDISKFRKKVSSLELIPGDIIEVPENTVIPCDLILLNGSCIMNECMLTGTKCIETRYFLKGTIPVLALVFQTGFNTMKGQLVRSILFPKNNSFQFYKDSLKFIGAMSCIAALGFIWSLVSLLHNNDDTQDIVLKCLDMITVTVPPALPACMTVGIQFALIRLKKKQIFCISPLKINISGKINIMCFDKTGTLTEEGLDTYGVRPVFETATKKTSFIPLKKVSDLNSSLSKPAQISPIPSGNILNNDSMVEKKSKKKSMLKQVSPEELMLEGLASCHSLTSVAGALIGDPLDIKMFESTGWILEDNNENKFDELVLSVVKPNVKMMQNTVKPNDFDSVAQSLIMNEFQHEIGIIRRFEFSSKLQRMSVIVKNLTENSFRLHIKGSPEKLRELCVKESIPANFHKVLDNYSKNGFRVLALASRPLQISFKNVHKYEREVFEKDVFFTGFLIMENKLKTRTLEIIDQLQEANVRTIMVTGDNALTAISVARQCHIVNPRQRVYLGDLSDKPVNGKYKLIWKDFDFSEHQLNPDTLKPAGGAEECKENFNEEIDMNEEDEESMERDAGNDKDTGTKDPASLKDPHSYTVRINHDNNSFEPMPMNSLQEKSLMPEKGGKKRKTKLNQTEVESKTLTHKDIKEFTRTEISPNSYSPNSKFTKSLVQQNSLDDRQIKKNEKIKKFKIKSLVEEDDSPPPWLMQENELFSLALTGRAFTFFIGEKAQSKEFSQSFNKMLEKCQVFARMKPAEKALLVQSLQESSKKSLVGMCGDGANDCGALKTADVGVSLSEAEASIAAPFTSKIQDISCIVKLLREGRCALSTSFQCFKYMALYSMIQFASVVMLYDSFSNLSDNQFLWIDLILIFPLAIFMSYTKSSKTLSTYMPTANLISFPVLSSVIGQILIQFGFQLGVYFWLKRQGFFQYCMDFAVRGGQDPDAEQTFWMCYETTTLFTFANFQYLATVLAFSIGPPFRQDFYKNHWFTGAWLILTGCCLYMIIDPGSWLMNFINLVDFPDSNWKLFIVIVAIINVIVTFLYEKVVAIHLTLYWRRYRERKELEKARK